MVNAEYSSFSFFCNYSVEMKASQSSTFLIPILKSTLNFTYDNSYTSSSEYQLNLNYIKISRDFVHVSPFVYLKKEEETDRPTIHSSSSKICREDKARKLLHPFLSVITRQTKKKKHIPNISLPLV